MLSKGMDVNAAPCPLPPMTPPLIEAVCTRDRDMVELLLDQRASLDARDVAYGRCRPHTQISKNSIPRSCLFFQTHKVCALIVVESWHF